RWRLVHGRPARWPRHPRLARSVDVRRAGADLAGTARGRRRGDHVLASGRRSAVRGRARPAHARARRTTGTGGPMNEEIARLPGGVEICYESFGDEANPTALLVMGLGCPMGWWSRDFCDRLVARGFRVVRFDNRDTGRSTHVRGARVTRQQIA